MVSRLALLAFVAASLVAADHGDDAQEAHFDLSASNNVANGSATTDETNGSGHGDVGWDHGTHNLTWSIMWSDLSSAVTSIEFRGPAMEGAEGPVIVSADDIEGPSTGSATLSHDDGESLEMDWVYVRINTVNFPNGEIRGEIRDLEEDNSAGKHAPLLIVAVVVALLSLVFA